VDAAGWSFPSETVKDDVVPADSASMQTAELDWVAACERRRLPGYQGIVAITADGTIVHASPGIDGRFGVDAATAVGRNFVEFVELDEAGQAVSSFGAVLERAGHHPAMELRIGPAGDRVGAHVVADNCIDELGVVIMNIADARERTMAVHLLGAQAEVVRRIALGDSLADALEAVSGFVATALPGFGSVAYVVDDTTGEYVGWGDGLAASSVRAIERCLSSGGTAGYVGVGALVDAEPKVVTDVDVEAWGETGARVGHGVRTVWSVPIRHDRSADVMGLLEVYGHVPLRPRDDEWVLLQLVSRLGAVAVDHARMQARLARDASVDPLTSIPNRRVITELLARALDRGERPVVCFVDLDHLKVVNDGLGHEAGDQVIAVAAERLRAAVGEAGHVGRFGGDEFVTVSERGATTPEEIGAACLRAFDEPVVVGERQWRLSASIGVVEVDAQTTPSEVLRDADAAMYEAKRSGRGRWVRFRSATRESVIRRLQLEQQLRLAIERDEVDAWFQPIVSSADWSLFGVEALARWRLPSGEFVPPADFITIAEETGLIDDLGLRMIDRALVARRVLAVQGHPHVVASVNLSPVQLQSDRLFERLRALGGSDHGLQLEMTEQRMIDDSEATLAELRRLIAFDVALAIDDFGTGYSTLGALHRITATTLKIDRSLIARADTPDGAAVVRAVVGVAEAFGMTTVAEGVETVGHASAVRRLGVDAQQGFLFGRARPLDELVGRLLRGGWAWDVDRARLDAGPVGTPVG
jgi:diguanylate cyclase (GGDEF)-like protein